MLTKHAPFGLLVAPLSHYTKINSPCNFGFSSFYNKTLHNGPLYLTKQMIPIIPFLINKHNGLLIAISFYACSSINDCLLAQ